MDQTEEGRRSQEPIGGISEAFEDSSGAEDKAAAIVGDCEPSNRLPDEVKTPGVHHSSQPEKAAEPAAEVQKQHPEPTIGDDDARSTSLPKSDVKYGEYPHRVLTERRTEPERADADADGTRHEPQTAQPAPTTQDLAASLKRVTITAIDGRNSHGDGGNMVPTSTYRKEVEEIEHRCGSVMADDGQENKGGPGLTPLEGDQRGGFRKALVGFYSVHNPERIGNLDVILRQYAGKEDLLIERLEQKYSADLSYARRAADIATKRHVAGETPRAAPPPAGGVTGPQQPQPIRSPQYRLPAEDSAALSRGDTTAFVTSRPPRGASDGPAVVQGGAPTTSSSNYMAFLADQIRYNVEGLLPASTNGGGSGGGRVGALSGTATQSMASPSPWEAQRSPYRDAADRSANAPATVHSGGSAAVDPRLSSRPKSSRDEELSRNSGSGRRGGSNYAGGQTVTKNSRHASLGHGVRALTAASFAPLEKFGEKGGIFESGVVTSGVGVGVGQKQEAPPDPLLVARVKALEEERAGLLSACRRLQIKSEAAGREAAATEELRDAGQRKIAGFAERAAAAERQARDAVARLRSLESAQAILQAEKEEAARRCAVKHAQLLSAIDVQASLRSQLEGLLGVFPPSLYSSSTTITTAAAKANAKANADRRREVGERNGDGTGAHDPVPTAAASNSTPQEGAGNRNAGETLSVSPEGEGVGGSDEVEVAAGGKILESSAGGEGWDSGGGDEGAGGGVDELKRRCSALGVSLRASRREALAARRVRDAAESTVRKQRELLAELRAKVSELEESLAKEKESRQVAARAASGLENELDLQLSRLRAAESKLSDQADETARLKEELRGASARLENASAARGALLSFCRLERTAVELTAAEHVSRAEENAGMRGEEGLARGLELARMAEEAGDKRAAALSVEVDRLGKALFYARAELAGSEARGQALRRELDRAAETIAGLSRDAAAAATVAAKAAEAEAEVEETAGKATSDGDTARAMRLHKLAVVDSIGDEGVARVVGEADVGAAIKAAVAAATVTPSPPEEAGLSEKASVSAAGTAALTAATPGEHASGPFWMCGEGSLGRGKPPPPSVGRHQRQGQAGYDVELL